MIQSHAGDIIEIDTNAGVDQGCPLEAFLYAVGTRSSGERVLQYARSLDPSSALYMYLDGVYVVAWSDCIDQILAKALEEFAKVGLKINEGKTRSWCAGPSSLSPLLRPTYREQFVVLNKALVTLGDSQHQGLSLDSGTEILAPRFRGCSS